jgi:hypothetical protein
MSQILIFWGRTEMLLCVCCTPNAQVGGIKDLVILEGFVEKGGSEGLSVDERMLDQQQLDYSHDN